MNYLVLGRKSVKPEKGSEIVILGTSEFCGRFSDEEDEMALQTWQEWMHQNAPELRKQGILYMTIVKMMHDERVGRPRTWRG